MKGKRLLFFFSGLFLITAGLFFVFSIIGFIYSGTGGHGGTVGDFVAEYGLLLFGWVSLWIPAIVIITGIGLLNGAESFNWLRTGIGSSLIFAGLLILLSYPFAGEIPETREFTRISSGAVGMLLTGWLHDKLGPLGLLASAGFCTIGGAIIMWGNVLPAMAFRSYCYAGVVLKKVCSFFSAAFSKTKHWIKRRPDAAAGRGSRMRKVSIRSEKKAEPAGSVQLKATAEPDTKQRPGLDAGADSGKKQPEIIMRRPSGDTGTSAAHTFKEFSKNLPQNSESDYQLPPMQILHLSDEEYAEGEEEEVIRERGEILERTLQEFNIEAEVVRVQRGPVVTMYEMALAPGTKVSKVESLNNDLAIALKAPNVRIVAPIPGKSTIGIEVPNANRETVTLRELFTETDKESMHMAIPLFLGKDTAGAPLLVDLAMAPHLLIAGATGSGKSVSINSIICSIIMTRTPAEVQMLLVDPKSVEFADYQELPHLICPVVTDMKKAAGVLQWACKKMDERFAMLSRVGVRNIGHYNRLGEEEIIRRLDPEEDAEIDDVPFYMPHVVIIIDELGELMLVAAKEVESSVIRLSQKARAVGIHLICATQRPSADIITSLIKANLPVKIAFQVSSKTNSRVILDRNGAELLLGRGDMLMIPPGSSRLIRAQGTFVSQSEAMDIVNFVSEQQEPQFRDELQVVNDGGNTDRMQEDELYEEALYIILETQRGSVSLLQRRLAIGYSRAARLIDMMADAGIVGPYKGSQAREVYMTLEEWESARA